MGLIGSFILKNLPAIAMSMAIAGALGYVEVLRLEVSHDKKVIATDKASLITAKRNETALVQSIDYQNAATRALAAEQARTQATAAKALQQARSGEVSVNRQVAALQAAKAGADQCKSTDQLILQSLPSS